MRIGKTGIEVGKSGFGCLPLQRINEKEAIYLIETAVDNNIILFDTARGYRDSENKLGKGLRRACRDKVYIATKSQALTKEQLRFDIEKSLKELSSDYIDIFQFHNPTFCPTLGDGTELYETLLEYKDKQLIKHIGLTSHKFEVAKKAIMSGEYETIQFPFSYISGEKEREIVKLCEEYNIGFFAMKALAGGLISDIEAAYAYMKQYKNVLPLWGIQRKEELKQYIFLDSQKIELNDKMISNIESDRKKLAGQFCRGCGYCMPCPKGIEINNCARMSLMMRKSDIRSLYEINFRKKMYRIKECINCGKCKNQCPYNLDIPQLLKTNLNDYINVLNGKTSINLGDNSMMTYEERSALHYPVMKKYLENALNGWSCVDYFKNNNYKKIAIYAMNEFAQLIYMDLKKNKNSDIFFSFYDKNYDRNEYDCKVEGIQNLCEKEKKNEIDCIVICSLVNEIQIRSSLCQLGISEDKLVSVAEVVFSNE